MAFIYYSPMVVNNIILVDDDTVGLLVIHSLKHPAQQVHTTTPVLQSDSKVVNEVKFVGTLIHHKRLD